MYCKECGNQISDDSKFCPSCGKLQGKEVVSNPQNPNIGSLQLEDKIAEEETLDKKLDSEIHQVICPNCKGILNIPSEIINEDYIQCLGCNQTIHNPLRLEKDISNFGCVKGCLIFLIISLVISILITLLLPDDESSSTSASNIGEQKIKARIELEQSIKANLREPKSYQNTATEVYTLEEYIYVKNTFRGKNRYGGYEICTVVAQFNFNTKPAEWAITNNPSSNSGCSAIMIAY